MNKMDAKAYTHDGERDFSEKEIIALCVCCTLATSMMPCTNNRPCPFAVGRAVRAVHIETMRLQAYKDTDDPSVVERFWETLPEWLWKAYYQYAFADADIKQTREHFVKLEKFSLQEERQAEAMAGCL
jgi:hypothetical protein